MTINEYILNTAASLYINNVNIHKPSTYAKIANASLIAATALYEQCNNSGITLSTEDTSSSTSSEDTEEETNTTEEVEEETVSES